MKKTNQMHLQEFKNLANKINKSIRTGQWDLLSTENRNGLKAALCNMYARLKAFFSRESLYKILGAAVFLISGNVSAQTFAPEDVNPFGIENTDSYIHQPIFVDLDGDGDLDILNVGSYTETFLYQENIGDVNNPNFAAALTNPFGLLPSYYIYSPKAVDLDGDGDFDILASGDYGVITYYENIGSATAPEFAAEVTGPFELDLIYTFLMDVVDIDNDGDYDILVSTMNLEVYAYQINYIENTGNATTPEFDTPVSEPFGLNPIPDEYISFGDFADLDLDGDMDLMRVDYYGGVVFYHENIGTAEAPVFASGNGVSAPFGIVFGGEYTSGLTYADIDGDGDQDVFVAEYYGNTYYYENIEYSLGIADRLTQLKLTVYPNPTTDFITIQTEIKPEELTALNILSLDGSRVMTLSTTDLTIDVADLSAGIYLLEIVTNENITIHRQFVKN